MTGISYLQNQDVLLITLFDGSFHVICDLCRDPRWASTSEIQNEVSAVDYGPLTSENLSKMSRSIFVKAEKENVDRRDMVRINGVTPYDDSSCFSWVYEWVSFFNYQTWRTLILVLFSADHQDLQISAINTMRSIVICLSLLKCGRNTTMNCFFTSFRRFWAQLKHV